MNTELEKIRAALRARGYIAVDLPNKSCYIWQVLMPTYEGNMSVGLFHRSNGRWIASQSWLRYLILGSLRSTRL